MNTVIATSLDTVIALIALIISLLALGTSVYFWRRSFRPIVTAAVRTHSGGNTAIAYDLKLVNSGTIPARNIRLSRDEASLTNALGNDATEENRRLWLACFSDRNIIGVLQNNESVSCSFGTTKGSDMGFWKYGSRVLIVIQYEGWFGKRYKQS